MKNVLDIVIRKWLHVSMKYRVVIKKKALKGIAKMPQEIQRRMNITAIWRINGWPVGG